PAVDPTFAGCSRTYLDERSWVDVAPEWMRGADVVLDELVARSPGTAIGTGTRWSTRWWPS
ncbi:MAG: hypothetical protein WD225_11315, partial [Ilumatobacteraceae bacterium]